MWRCHPKVKNEKRRTPLGVEEWETEVLALKDIYSGDGQVTEVLFQYFDLLIGPTYFCILQMSCSEVANPDKMDENAPQKKAKIARKSVPSPDQLS